MAQIGGSGTPIGPKPDAGRETADFFGESSGGPSTKDAYKTRVSLPCTLDKDYPVHSSFIELSVFSKSEH